MRILIRLVALLTLGLAAGIVFSHVLQMSQKTLLDTSTFLDVQQILLATYGPVLGILEGVAFGSVLVTAIMEREKMGSLALLVLSAVCVGAMLVIWVFLIAPLNATVDAWTADTIPANWEQIRDQWAMLQTVRFGLAVIAFGTYILVVLGEREAASERL